MQEYLDTLRSEDFFAVGALLVSFALNGYFAFRIRKYKKRLEALANMTPRRRRNWGS